MTLETAATSPRPTRVTKRRAETRARLLDAAYRVFADKGFGRVRIEDVCAAAGYTRGAFYSQFDSLDELFFTLYDQRAEQMVQQLSDAIAEVSDGLDIESTLDRVAETLLLERDWLLVKTDFLMHAARHPDVATRLMQHRRQLRDAIAQRFSVLHVSLPEQWADPSDAARAAIAAYDGVTVQLLLDADLPAARAWMRQLLTALLNANDERRPDCNDERRPDCKV
jgi:AcrR family transcriptional regulator